MEKEIEKLRNKINNIDSRIISSLRERFSVVRRVGKYKKSRGLKIKDMKREKEVINRVIKKASEQGIKDLDEIKSIFRSIMKSSRDIQKKG